VDIPREQRPKRRRYIIIAAAGALLVLTTVALARLGPAAPTVERGGLLIDSVRRGQMVRQVRGPGTLVPEQIRWISAVTGGRVERVLVHSGDHVQAGTVLLDMTNPDVQLEALTAQQQVAAAEAQLVSLRTNLETTRLNQAGVVANMRSQLRDAQRNATGSESLATRNLISQNEYARLHDQVQELTERLQIEQQRLQLLTQTADSQLTLQREQIGRLRAISDYQQGRVASMHVVAGVDGVVQDLGAIQGFELQPGQWVQSGTTLARVVQPGRLKAVIRIPETQAPDVAVGQPVEIDTRIGIVHGRVVRTDPSAVNGQVAVDVSIQEALPQGARPDLSVDGTIEVERLRDVLYTGRPAFGQPNSTVGLFKLTEGDRYAERVNVRLGRGSATTIEIVAGLKQGDGVILSDMSRWDNVDRVRVK
jgi:multidrug efflux pump subunit AcrA (membrane-fusion protein)